MNNVEKMETKLIAKKINVNDLYKTISNLIINAKSNIGRNINLEMITLYWNIGKIIINVQLGEERAKYGATILENLSTMLTNNFGQGFSLRNLKNMRKFYKLYPNIDNISQDVSWSHYLELIKINEEPKRKFYLNECINSRWSVRELQRQKNSLLYERLVLTSPDKVEVKNKSNRLLVEAKDIIKDPVVLEFLEIEEESDYLESDLERNILNHIKEFMLELGKGFSFVGNQVRINLDGEYFYPDLVLYNRLLRCFVIIDLKIGKVTHQDIGQIQMYTNYYDREIKEEYENPTIGILLSTDKNETVVKYTLPKDNKTIFSKEYKLHLPTEQELINAVEDEKKNIELNKEE